MPGDLYWDDTLAWSEQQATRLRRLAAGERVNDVDWAHVIEEIEDVGKTELRACESLLQRALEHLVKLHAWPDHSAAMHWRREIRTFLRDAAKAFSPSMRQLLDVPAIYAASREDVLAVPYEGLSARPVAEICPLTLDDLLTGAPLVEALAGRLAPRQDGNAG